MGETSDTLGKYRSPLVLRNNTVVFAEILAAPNREMAAVIRPFMRESVA
jgi:hypothetical protein